MALFVRDAAEGMTWRNEWSFPGLPPFMESRNLETVLRELGRYVRGEVAGRSFLIAGHRGAGKTSLIRRAIESYRLSLLKDSVQGPANGRMAPPQRPLLVKLHGPSLILAGAEAGADPLWPKPGSVAGSAAEVTLTFKPAATGSKVTAKDPPVATTQQVLVQITIGLYRALAQEAADTFAIHAREAHREKPGDQLELAGQLVLDLDRAPDPGTLRSFWARLDRLTRGVLWPDDAAWLLKDIGSTSQGVREIVALSTAAQAFQVCSGAVKDSETDTGTASREEAVSGGAGFNAAQLVNRLLSVVVGAGATGALAAGGVAGGVGSALAGGLFAGLVTNFAFDWSGKRNLKTEKVRDYAFILDRSVQSLERDLPLVIERVRGAGLAPVFVVDELDKLEDPEGCIKELISKLKHLITDFGFFCFLTDRKYYQYIQQLIRDNAFPQEHTFFSDRIFIMYRPEEFKAFLDRIIVSDQPDNTPERVNDEFARKVFSLCMLHKAKLGTSDLVRELAQRCDLKGKLRAASDDIRSAPENHLIATVQLAVELILRGPELRRRMDDEPAFAQLAVDALYRLSRTWEDEAPDYEPGRESLLHHLARRIDPTWGPAPASPPDPAADQTAAGDASASRAAAEAALGADPTEPADAAPAGGAKHRSAEAVVLSVIGPLDIKLLVRQVARLEGYMLDFATLRHDFERDLPLEGREILDIIPAEPRGQLIVKDESGRHRFVFDAFGLRAGDADAGAPEAPPYRAITTALEAVCRAAGTSPEALIDFEVLPRAIAWTGIQQGLATMESPTAGDDDLKAAQDRLATFVSALSTPPGRASRIAAMVALIKQTGVDAGIQKGGDMRAALQALTRYASIRGMVENIDQPLADQVGSNAPALPPADDGVTLVEGLTNWAEAIEAMPWGPSVPMQTRIDRSWTRWRTRVLQHLASPEPPDQGVDYDDIVTMAAGLAPGSLFQRSLGQLSVYDWSNAALAAFPAAGGAGPAQFWLALGSLRALGFAGRPLVTLQQTPPSGSVTADDDSAFLAPNAPDRPGLLYLSAADNLMAVPPDTTSDLPIMTVPQQRVPEYASVFSLLRQIGLFEAWSGESQ